MCIINRQLVIVIYLIYCVSYTYETGTINNTFVATKEWQTIEEGQRVPAGLYIRVNLHTGKKEAKLLDEDDDDSTISISNDKSMSALPATYSDSDNNYETSLDDKKPKISKKLEDTLKKIQKKTLSLEYSLENFEEMKARVKKSYKDYRELKREFQDMKMSFKTDSELITGLLKEFNSTLKNMGGFKEFLSILEDLNYLVHQIDNALWFIDSGGLDFAVLPMIVNQTNLEYRISALRLLGALIQNNPKAQVKVYEKNFGSYISNILFKSNNAKELSSALYAFGSLLRKFPHAQKEILSKSGTKSLIEVLKKDTELKNKAKTLILIADLIRDQENILSDKEYSASGDNFELSKIEQYYDINFDVWLKDNKFCEVVIDLVWKSQNEMLSHPDYTDDIIEALTIISKVCQKSWSTSTALEVTLTSLENDFKISNQEYIVEVAEKLTNLKVILFSNYVNLAKEEL